MPRERPQEATSLALPLPLALHLPISSQPFKVYFGTCLPQLPQLPNGLIKVRRRWGQCHPQGANSGSNGELKLMLLARGLIVHQEHVTDGVEGSDGVGMIRTIQLFHGSDMRR
jgi:hypothetical protein